MNYEYMFIIFTKSFRLVNYDNLSQDPAAVQINVSLPTFTRICNKALKQITISFVEGTVIEIEVAKHKPEKESCRCKRCNNLTEGIENHF